MKILGMYTAHLGGFPIAPLLSYRYNVTNCAGVFANIIMEVVKLF